MPPLKDLSETIRNLVAAGALLVGGVWILYEWDTLFPKTEADVARAAATIGSDVTGTLHVRLADFPQADAVSAICAESSSGEAFFEVPLFGRLEVASTSAVPLWVEVGSLDVGRWPLGRTRLLDGPVKEAHVTVPRVGRFTALSPHSFLGGAGVLRIAPRSRAETHFAVKALFPFDCASVEPNLALSTVYAISIFVSIETMSPVTGERLPETNIHEAFVRPCLITATGELDCTIEPALSEMQK